MMRSLPKLTCLCYAAHLVLVLHENSATVDVNDADGVPSGNAKRAVRANYAKLFFFTIKARTKILQS